MRGNPDAGRFHGEGNVGALIIGIGFWAQYTIIIIRSPKDYNYNKEP